MEEGLFAWWVDRGVLSCLPHMSVCLSVRSPARVAFEKCSGGGYFLSFIWGFIDANMGYLGVGETFLCPQLQPYLSDMWTAGPHHLADQISSGTREEN